MEKEEGSSFAVVSKDVDHLIGCVVIRLTGKQDNLGEIGFWLGAPFRRQGICTEAVNKLLEFSFFNFKLNCIKSKHYPGNLASSSVLKKVGFKYEGCLRQRAKIKTNVRGLIKKSLPEHYNFFI